MNLSQALATAVQRGFVYTPWVNPNAFCIVDLEPERVSALLRTGRLEADVAQWARDVEAPVRPGLCLVYTNGIQDELWDCEPPATLRPFLEGCYLGEYNEDAGKGALTLVSNRSLYVLLPEHAAEPFAAASPTLLESAERPSGPKLSEDELRRLKAHPNFSGRYRVCSCGETGCGADFVWIENGRALFWMATGGAMVTCAWLYPFRMG